MKKVNNLYVDGFVLVVPKKNLAAYKKMAGVGKIWIKHGALEYRECIGDDLTPDMGKEKIMTFPRLLKLKPSEAAFFSYITYKSKKHRDQVNRKVMKDPAMNDPKYANMKMPFDMKRMTYGGFKTIVSF